MRGCCVAALAGVLGLGCAERASSPAPARLPVGSTPPAAARTAEPSPSSLPQTEAPDYLVLAPDAFVPALAPLVELRRTEGHVVELLEVADAYDRFAEGSPEPLALLRAVRDAWQRSEGRLRYLLIVGDPPDDGELAEPRVPTFYLPKVDYSGSDDERRYPRRMPLSLTRRDPRTYPTDHPFALVGAPPQGMLEARPVLAVGRVPARSAAEVEGFVRKVIDHERSTASGRATRRLVVMAGQVRFGKVLDRVVESVALRVLDEQVPSQYELDVVFAKPGSPYAYRFDQLADRMVAEAERGALLLVYVGHSSAQSFDGVEYRGGYYPIATGADFSRMDIHGARPLFLSLSCDAGEFDLDGGARSIAEEAVLNPGGPVAAFAASRESHPYPNLLYGEAFVAELLVARPRTIGDALLGARVGVEERSSMLGELLAGVDTDELRSEHASLYNLLGDPATRLPTALSATVTIEPASSGAIARSSPIVVRVASEVTEGVVEVRLETPRSVVARRRQPDADLEALPLEQAFVRMADRHEQAIDKLVTRTSVEFRAGQGRAELTAPAATGRYVVKALVTGTRGGIPATAIGAATLLVGG